LGTQDVSELDVDATGDEIVLVAVEADPTVGNWCFLGHCTILLFRTWWVNLTRKAGRVQF